MIQTALLLATLALPGPAVAKEMIAWGDKFEPALAAAAKSKRTVMIDFYTDWCGWCKRLDADTYSDASVGKVCEKMVCVKLNAERVPEIARRYGVRGYPAIIFVNAKGDKINEISGYLPPDKFKDRVNEILKSGGSFAKMQSGFALKGDQPGVAREYADECIKRQQAQDAETAIAKIEKVEGKSAAKLDELYIKLGYLYGSKGEYPAAIRCGQTVLTRYPAGSYSDQAHFLLGAAYLDQKKTSECREHLDWVVQNGRDAGMKSRAQTLLEKLQRP